MLDLEDCAERGGGANENGFEDVPMPRFMAGGKENGLVVGSLNGTSFGGGALTVVGGFGRLNTGAGLLNTGFG